MGLQSWTRLKQLGNPALQVDSLPTDPLGKTSSLPDYLPKAPPTNTITSEVEASNMNFGRDTNTQPVPPLSRNFQEF